MISNTKMVRSRRKKFRSYEFMEHDERIGFLMRAIEAGQCNEYLHPTPLRFPWEWAPPIEGDLDWAMFTQVYKIFVSHPEASVEEVVEAFNRCKMSGTIDPKKFIKRYIQCKQWVADGQPICVGPNSRSLFTRRYSDRGLRAARSEARTGKPSKNYPNPGPIIEQAAITRAVGMEN